ncbi:MAG: Ig-like domain-containing protein [Muribaculaceae bacterium]|nr:Ig-like domain-containing protein [Muribaculaceae bacterium]MCM1439322.1 Ig-like domain-containing protein [Roseburia sp.]
MALGQVNVPGASGADVAGAKKAAENAVKMATEAKATAEAAAREVKKLTAVVNTTPFQGGSLVYNGGVQSPVWNGFDTEKLEISGATSGTDAGEYTAIFTPKEGYMWDDETTEGRSVIWTIGRASLTVPVQNGSLTYTGNAQSPQWTGYDSGKMTLGGVTSGTNAGSYNATFTAGDNYQWADGTTGEKTVAWSIAKAAGSLTMDKSSMTLDISTKTGTITVTRPGDGAITATSSNPDVASVSVSGNKITVTGKKDGNATITVQVAAGTNHTTPADKTCAVVVNIPNIYGASWDGSSTTKWTRTDDAALFTDPVPYVKGASSYGSPFDNLQPWAGMTKSERTGGTMVAIPKFWYKLTQNGAGMKIQIADKAAPGFSVSPAHMDRGDGKGERSVVYIGRYHCHTSDWKSKTGGKPKANITRATARSSIHALGTNIWQNDFAMRFTLWILYIVEFADWNSQKTIGKGCGDNSATGNMGYTDSMPYHTGTTQSRRDTYGLGTQYRNIEGLWDNVLDWCDGCYNASNGLNIILNPNNFSDSAGGTSIGTPSSGWPGAFTVSSAGGFPMFYASATGGSETTYSCDYWNFDASYPCVFVGGYYSQSGNRGLFFVSYITASYTSADIGSRLQELP